MSADSSILRRVLVFVMAAVFVVWLILLILIVRSAQHEVKAVFDADLLRSARILSAVLLHEVHVEREVDKTVRGLLDKFGYDSAKRVPSLSAAFEASVGTDARGRAGSTDAKPEYQHRYETSLAFVALKANGRVLLRSNGAPDFAHQPLGFSDFDHKGDEWRVHSLQDPESGFIVHVGEPVEARNELVRQITRNTLTPMFVGLPVVALLIVLAVRTGMEPLRRVAKEVGRRAPDSLRPIAKESAPCEVHTLLTALNLLFRRVEGALQREQQFTADAAHELRTPLAALKTHLQVARNQTGDSEVTHSIDQALEGVDRATHSVEQLLALARAGAEQHKQLLDSNVNLRETAMDVVSAMSQQAIDRDVDLGLEANDAVRVHGDATLLRIMLRNLVDNAVCYNRPGGVVTVKVGVDGGHPVLGVIDDGPGIDTVELPRLFDRFRRGPEQRFDDTSGSGLGLSIVQRIARLHGALLDVGSGPSGRGTEVAIRFPGAFEG